MILELKLMYGKHNTEYHTSLSVMAYPGARVVILCCFFVHFAFNADLVIVQGASSLLTGLMHLVQGITLLFYPVLGLVADLKCNRYNFVKVSIILLSISSLLMVLFISALLALSVVNSQLWIQYLHMPLVAIVIIFIILSLGMFDAEFETQLYANHTSIVVLNSNTNVHTPVVPVCECADLV